MILRYRRENSHETPAVVACFDTTCSTYFVVGTQMASGVFLSQRPNEKHSGAANIGTSPISFLSSA